MRVWALLAVLLFIPAASGQVGIWNPDESTPVTLWMHCVGLGDCPVNTQQPSETYNDIYENGIIANSQGCQDVPEARIASDRHHTHYGYSSPSYVDYDIDDGGKPRYFPERGITYDVLLDTDVVPVFEWFVATSTPTGQSNLPGIAPQVQVTMTMLASDDISVGYEAINSAAVMGQGSSDAVDLYPGVSHPQVTHYNDDGLDVYGFKFPIALLQDRIDRDDSFSMRVDLHMANPVCNDAANDEYVMPDLVERYAANGFWPNLQLNIFNPLRVEYLNPQFIGDDLVFHASAASPWGGYDVLGDEDEPKPQLLIQGPSEPERLEMVKFVSTTHVHGETQRPPSFTWVWEYDEDEARQGLYQATLVVQNDQQTATAWANATFEIGTGNVEACGMSGPSVDAVAICQTSVAQPETTTPFPFVLVAVGLLALARSNKP